MENFKKLFSVHAIDLFAVIAIASVSIIVPCVIYTLGIMDSTALKSYLVIAVVGFLCMLLVQKNRLSDKSIFELLAETIMGKWGSDIEPIEFNKTKAAILVHFGTLLALLSHVVYSLMVGNTKNIIFSVALFFILILFSVFFYNRKNKPPQALYAIFLALPAIMAVGGFTPTTQRVALIWLLISLIYSLFVFGDFNGKIFNIFFVIIFVEALYEPFTDTVTDYEKVTLYGINLLIIGFILYVTSNIFLGNTKRDLKNYEDVVNKLKDTQSILIQKEKMGMLGTLIAGIAHEINTPIGAIKASAETLSATSKTMVTSLTQKAKDLNDEDRKALFIIMELMIDSMKAMKSTIQMRKEKRALKEYFDEIELPNSDEILSKLSRLEICDPENIKEHIELVKSENILVLLDAAVDLSSYITATETILFASDKITKIVFALKSYGHSTVSNEATSFDLVKNIENVLVLYHNQTKANVTIVRDYDDDIPCIMGHSDDISQIWTNIIQNALHAIDSKGTITIGIRNKQNENLEITFTDTGKGIPPAVIDKIFDPFYTTKPVGEGSGLGLDICRKIARSHNGDISVESVVGVGTKFTVKLPVKMKHEGEL